MNKTAKESASDPRFATLYTAPSLAASHLPDGVTSTLDVGCGTGTMAALLKTKGIQVDGVTWNAEELELAAPHCRSVIQCDLNEGIPDLAPDAYDLIICSHILEHIAYPQKLMSDLYRTLKPEGHLIVVIPNIFFWPDRLKLLRGQWEYTSSGTFDYTHLRWYTIGAMTDLLATHGFKLEYSEAHGWIPAPGLRYLVGAGLRSRINNLACKWMPGLFGQQLLFRAKKAV